MVGQKGFRLLGWFGIALAMIALSDAALALVPPLWGSVEWVFSTGAQLMSSLPVLAVALGAMTVGAFGAGGVGLVRTVGALNVLLVLAVVGVLALFAPAASKALEIGVAAAQPGIRKVIVRVTLYAVVFGALHITLAVACIRSARQLAAAGDRATRTAH